MTTMLKAIGWPETDKNRAEGGRRTRWSRKHTLVAAALGALVLFWMVAAGPSNREVALSFAGFTNYNGELHAWLWFTNGALPSVWWVPSVSHKTGDAWVGDGEVGPTIHEKIPDWERWPVLDPAHQVYLISFKVREAKLPLRVITLVQERSSGLAGVKERMEQWNYEHWQRRSQYVAHGRRYYATNEFWNQP